MALDARSSGSGSRGRLVLVVGAGASVARPACLPNFDQLRGALLERIEVGPKLSTAASSLAPETFMRVLFEGLLPLEKWLSMTLSSGAPNAVHGALATAIARGATVWTVNADELIEEALKRIGASALVATYPDTAPHPGAVLLKPHGTVSCGHYVFRADQVVQPMPRPWAERLRRDLSGSDVVLIGYQGLDIDLRVVLGQALQEARTITWFEHQGNEPGLRRRFSVLDNPNAQVIGGTRASTLTPLFLGWAGRRGFLDGVAPELLQSAREEPSQPEIPSIRGSATLARALLVERCGDGRSARNAYRAALRTWDPRKARRAVIRLAKLSLYEPTRWASRLLRLSATKYAVLLPRFLRRNLDRVHVTILSSSEGQHEAAMRRADLAVAKDDPAILIAQSKAARYLGDLRQAEELAARGATLSDDHRAVEEGAHAVFELTITQTFAGRFADARRSLELLVGRDSLASARWIAWGEWQRACLDLYADNHESAFDALQRARELFKTEGLATGEVACLTARLTANRLCDDVEGFDDAIRELGRWRGCHGWTDFIDSTIDLERAEFARAHHDLESAHAALDRVIAASVHRPIHLAMGYLARGELTRVEGKDNRKPMEQVRKLANQHGFGYLQAHAAITETLAGRMTFGDLTRELKAIDVPLATRDGQAPRSAKDYCLGGNPDAHEIFLPT
jgi:hypothetical protein